ncbi:hypothetical protein CPB85DRAFT_1257604 [Mucidula mucida]|nr:hypothetical protein CPB85DRAFT_1257604 [Mucidula mucida]
MNALVHAACDGLIPLDKVEQQISGLSGRCERAGDMGWDLLVEMRKLKAWAGDPQGQRQRAAAANCAGDTMRGYGSEATTEEVLARWDENDFLCNGGGAVEQKQMDGVCMVSFITIHECFSGLGTQKCLGCQYVHYCGTDCQQSHWRVHKRTCRVPSFNGSPLDWMNIYRGFTCWAAIQALHLHSAHSAFKQGQTLSVLILYGKQALREDTPTNFRVVKVTVVPINPTLDRLASGAANDAIQAAGGIGALAAHLSLTNTPRPQTIMEMPMALQFPEMPDPGYQYVPVDEWEKLYAAACNEMVLMDQREMMAIQRTSGNARVGFWRRFKSLEWQKE